MNEPQHLDDGTAAEQTDDEDPMNVRQGSWGQSIATALVMGVVTIGLTKLTDSRDEKDTAASIATLTANVANLTEQVRKLSEQPYATRTDLTGISNRVDGIDSRLRDVERTRLDRRYPAGQ